MEPSERTLRQERTREKRVKRLNEMYSCMDCGLGFAESESYMVKHDIWLRVVSRADRKKCLCISCLVQRLGRSLELDDFTDVPVNRLLFIGYQMALRLN